MTRRERLERKVERRQEWAANRRTAANAVFKRNEPFTSDYAFNTQPGHIPLRARIIKQEDRAFESLQVAAHHESKAAGLQDALDRSIYSDDDNAVEAIEQRIADHEAERERMRTVNKLYRKGDAAGLTALGLDLEALKTKLTAAGPYWGSAPHLPYEMSNLGGRITADRKRLEAIKTQQRRTAEAEAAPNGLICKDCGNGYVFVTFAEKPEREILNALREAGFHWGGGGWGGYKEKLPQEVKDLLMANAPTEGDQHSEPTYENQLWHAHKLLTEQGREALENPHAMTGRICGCGKCFCCAAVQVLDESA